MSSKTFSIIGAILGIFALGGQLWLILVNRTMSIPATIVEYCSYFTILCNGIVTLCYFSNLGLGSFFSKPKVQAAALLYITVVGLVYNIILRQLWSPKGLQLVVDELLHTVNPILYMIYWWRYAKKNILQWKDVFQWLLFPLCYVTYVFIRGSITNLYPYPFMNVVQLGYPRVFFNSFLVFAVFLFISALIIWIAKMRTAIVAN